MVINISYLDVGRLDFLGSLKVSPIAPMNDLKILLMSQYLPKLLHAEKDRGNVGNRLGNTRYKVENWSEYNEALRRRGDITVWISEDLLEDWYPKKLGQRGRPKLYSDLAIKLA